MGQCEKIPSQSRAGNFSISRIVEMTFGISSSRDDKIPSRPMPVSSLMWTRALLRNRVAADAMRFAESRSTTGRTTFFRTISAISSGRIDERIWTFGAPFLTSSSTSNGSATPKWRHPASIRASAYAPTERP